MRDRLKKIRKAVHMNQTQFAKRVGMAQTSYSQLERGDRPILDRHVIAICKVFGVNELWLREGSGEMYSDTPSEDAMMELFRSIPEDQQLVILRTAIDILKINNTEIPDDCLRVAFPSNDK